MRVYVPITLTGLAGWVKEPLQPPVAAHAVTPAVREWYTEGDLEELEFATLLDAARACLDLLEADPEASRRRVVVALDVPDASVSSAPGEQRSAVRVQSAVAISAVVSVHVDEEDATGAVEEAVQALPAARAGDEDASFVLDEAEDHDLLWYDVSELSALLG